MDENVASRTDVFGEGIAYRDYANCDNILATCADKSDEEILAEFQGQGDGSESQSDDEDNDDPPVPKPTFREAMLSFEKVKSLLVSQIMTESDMRAMRELEQILYSTGVKSQKQSFISDFFHLSPGPSTSS